MGVLTKLAPDVVDKDLRVRKVFLEEGFEVRPRNKSNAFVMALMVSPSKADDATEVSNGKQGRIHSGGVRCLKMIFTLLIKIIAIYVRLF